MTTAKLSKIFAALTALELQVEVKKAEAQKLLEGLTFEELRILSTWETERRNKIYAETHPEPPIRYAETPPRMRGTDGIARTATEVLQLPPRRVLAEEIDWQT